jgi:NIMA (never in mitosis gene a)-related kinase
MDMIIKFSHPHIAKFFGCFQNSSKFYIVREYVDGVDLSKFLHNRKDQNDPLPKKFILKLISQLISALKYIHDHKIIHRSIKSSNILLTLDNDVKICDFGLLKEIESSTQEPSAFMGSIFYMPPEVLSDSKYSFYTDI